MLKTTVVLFSLFFCLWIVVIYGEFLYINNVIISQSNIFKNEPEIIGFFDIQGKLNHFLWLLEASKEFFIIGVENLFIPSSTDNWKLFMTINEWVYKSIIFLDVINIMLNIFRIGNYNHSNTNK